MWLIYFKYWTEWSIYW